MHERTPIARRARQYLKTIAEPVRGPRRCERSRSINAVQPRLLRPIFRFSCDPERTGFSYPKGMESQPSALPAEAAVFQMLQGLWTSHIVSALAKLKVPDRVASGPKSAEDLARETGADPRSLARLLRTAAALGVLNQDASGRFHQNPLSEVLRSDAMPGLRGIAAFFSDEWHTRSWDHLLESVRTGRPALDLVYGMPFFEYFAKHPEQAATFFQGMTDFSNLEGPAVAGAYDFSPFGCVCDVGGGLGRLTALILRKYPAVRGVLFDQPHVIGEASTQPYFDDLRDRVRFQAGDMFESVPAGVDAYVLKRIVHDWPDAECAKLLAHCRRGVNPGGKLLVVEQVIVPHEPSIAAKLMDLEMMVLLGGREREEPEFRKMFADSGWRLLRVIPTNSAMYIMEGEPA